MTIIGADDVAVGDTLTADVCVIGGGAAGITLARCLDGKQTRVLVLEAGGTKQDRAAEADSFEIRHTGVPHHDGIPSRGRWLGGATNLWWGRIALPDPIDFEVRPWVPHSGWPMAYGDLDPWLRIAADILDVSQYERFDISTWPANPTADTFSSATNTELRSFFWSDAPNMAKAARSIMEKSANVTSVTRATVNNLRSDNGRTITGADVVGPGGRTFSVTASWFVLAAGGLENPRLLLASTDADPSGIGNGHGNVGRYYLDHPRGEGLASVDLRHLSPAQIERFRLLGDRARGPFGTSQLRVVFPQELQRREGLLNHGLHGHLVADAQSGEGFESLKRLRARVSRRDVGDRSALAADLLSVAKATPGLAGFALGQRTPTTFVVVDQMEQEPDPGSSLSVDHRDLDSFGLPRLTLDWRIADSTKRSQHRMHELFRDALRVAGIDTFRSDVLDRPDETHEIIDMKHPSGTTRMSRAPSDGVVDPDCRVHGVDNLLIAGTSIFPTIGHFNPTLLIVALAARMADWILQQND